jgi:hypothetical protein
MAAAVSQSGVRGPLLVASPRVDPASTDWLVLNLSDFPPEEFDRALGIWKDRVSRDPMVWKDGFNLVIVREALRNFIQVYGLEIVTIVRGK